MNTNCIVRLFEIQLLNFNGDFMDLYFNTWAKFATFEGKATRSEYWTFVLVNTLIKFILAFVSIAMGLYTSTSQEHTLLDTLFVLIALIPTIAVSIRRLHDINLSGWWGWLFIPLTFPIFIVGLIKSKN